MSEDPSETNEKQGLQGSPDHSYGDVRNHRKKLKLWRREEPKRKTILIHIYMCVCVGMEEGERLFLNNIKNWFYLESRGILGGFLGI